MSKYDEPVIEIVLPEKEVKEKKVVERATYTRPKSNYDLDYDHLYEDDEDEEKAEFDNPEPIDADITIRYNDKSLSLKAKDVKSTEYKPPFLFGKGQIIVVSKVGESIEIPVTTHDNETLYEKKLLIDRYAKINAYEYGTFRSPILYNVSFTEMIQVIVIAVLTSIPAIAGIVLFMIGFIGVIIGIPLILIAFFTNFIVIRSAKNAIEGKCPICDKKFQANRLTPSFYCSKCKEKVEVKKDYFEV